MVLQQNVRHEWHDAADIGSVPSGHDAVLVPLRIGFNYAYLASVAMLVIARNRAKETQ
jgi:hypothetical protein